MFLYRIKSIASRNRTELTVEHIWYAIIEQVKKHLLFRFQCFSYELFQVFFGNAPPGRYHLIIDYHGRREQDAVFLTFR